jgi:hypothetical protein
LILANGASVEAAARHFGSDTRARDPKRLLHLIDWLGHWSIRLGAAGAAGAEDPALDPGLHAAVVELADPACAANGRTMNESRSL